MGLENGAIISLLFYVIYGATVLIPFLVRGTQGQGIDPLSPYLVISALLFFYSISTLRAFEANGLAEALQAATASPATV